MGYLIDNLQYANWSEKIFRQMREGSVDAVHVTITYHESFREMVLQLEATWLWSSTTRNTEVGRLSLCQDSDPCLVTE